MNTPKLNNNASTYIQSEWYKYYPGFADSFVKERIENVLGINKEAIIVDPWNGAGTTTLVATMLGFKNYGFDINPVMVIVSKAKLYVPSEPRQKDLFGVLKGNLEKVSITKDDYLRRWFTDTSVRAIKKLEGKFQEFCLGKKLESSILMTWNIETISSELCFYYLGLFNILRNLSKKFKTSNPTWIKSNILDKDKIKIKYDELFDMWREIVVSMSKMNEIDIKSPRSIITMSNSKNINLASATVDMVLTSPPYCTRLDYVIYTQVELALLGMNKDSLDELRRNMIGTPTITKANTENNFGEDTLCYKTLQLILKHESKAAKTYYFKTYLQYFSDMISSIDEISRILKKDGVACIVVQDSWFKDIYINVADIVTEMFMNKGFRVVDEDSFIVKTNMAYINTSSKKYSGIKENCEKVLLLRKVG